jgi:hypothetical protein
MAVLTVNVLPGTQDYDGVEITASESVSTGGDTFASSGWEFLRLENTNGTGSETVTITSVVDDLGRTKDCAVVLAAGEIWLAGPFAREGWMTSSAIIDVSATGTGVSVEVIRFPSGHNPA